AFQAIVRVVTDQNVVTVATEDLLQEGPGRQSEREIGVDGLGRAAQVKTHREVCRGREVQGVEPGDGFLNRVAAERHVRVENVSVIPLPSRKPVVARASDENIIAWSSNQNVVAL